MFVVFLICTNAAKCTHTHVHVSPRQSIYSQGWGGDDAARVGSGGRGQWGGRKTTFAAE